ncbi:MAG: CBS domain-containing protein [Thermodesulfobacteriota bacterium]
MFVGKRMTKDPKTVSADDTLSDAARIMREHGFNHLPVMEGERLAGILTDTDLRNASIDPGGAAGGNRAVREVMRSPVWSLTPEDSVEDALLVITRKRFGALPVLSGDRLVGIITKSDLLKAFADVLDLDEVCFCVDVSFPRSLSRFEELIGMLGEMGIAVRSCVISPRGEAGALNAHLRVATIDGPAVRRALRRRGFLVGDPASQG